MCRFPTRTFASIALGAALAADVSMGQAEQRLLTHPQGTAQAASLINPPVGIEVLLQARNPLAPDDDLPRSVLEQPTGLSGPMLATWDAAREMMSDPKNPASVPALLSKGGLIAPGVNLYDVKLTTEQLSGITLIGGKPDQQALQVTQTIVRISNPKVDSGNFSGDVIKAIADFCSGVAYGKNLNTLIAYALGDTNLAADPQHGGLCDDPDFYDSRNTKGSCSRSLGGCRATTQVTPTNGFAGSPHPTCPAGLADRPAGIGWCR